MAELILKDGRIIKITKPQAIYLIKCALTDVSPAVEKKLNKIKRINLEELELKGYNYAKGVAEKLRNNPSRPL